MARKIIELTNTQKQNISLLIEILNEWNDEDKFNTTHSTRIKNEVEKVLQNTNKEDLFKLYEDWMATPTDVTSFFLEFIENLIEQKGACEIKQLDKKRKQYPFTTINGNGVDVIINHSDNTKECFNRRGVVIKYNELIKDCEVTIPGKEFHDQSKNTAILTVLKDFCSEESVPYQNIEEHIMKMAGDNAYHPVRDWFNTITWDGVSRLDELQNTLTLGCQSDSEITKMLLTKWLIMGVAAVLEPNGISPQGALTLVGRQGIGKTRWLNSLMVDSSWATTGMQIDPNNKDDVIRFIKNWIVELGEVDATFRKSDIAALKAFITRNEDSFRAPYGKKVEDYPRQTIFYATVNQYEFLQDTENRRFWPVNVTAVNANHDIDIVQLWAEAKFLYEQGHSYWLDREELAMLTEHNEQFTAIEPMIEKVLSAGIVNPVDDMEGFVTTHRKNCTQILFDLGINSPTKKETNILAAYLRQQGFVIPDVSTRQFLIAYKSEKINDSSNVVKGNFESTKTSQLIKRFKDF